MDEINAAIIVVGSEAYAIESISEATLSRLYEIGLARRNGNEWQLTIAGHRHLKHLLHGEAFESLRRAA